MGLGVSGVRPAADVSSNEAGPQSGWMYIYVLYRFVAVTETQRAAPQLAHGAKPRRAVTCHMRLRHETYKAAEETSAGGPPSTTNRA